MSGDGDRHAAERMLRAIERIETQAHLYGERCDVFYMRIKNNTRELSPAQREALIEWLDAHHERLLAALADEPEIPRLNLTRFPLNLGAIVDD